MASPKGPYTIWHDSGEGWAFTDYATLQEAIASDKFSSGWVVMKPVEWSAVEVSTRPKPDGDRTGGAIGAAGIMQNEAALK